jgi:hypothetical protein
MSNIEFILSLQPLYDVWKKTQVFAPTPEQGAILNNVHREIFGRNLAKLLNVCDRSIALTFDMGKPATRCTHQSTTCR